MNTKDQFHRYHWGLIIGPKSDLRTRDIGLRFDAMEKFTSQGPVWQLVEEPTSLKPGTTMILVRIMIGKIKNRDRLLSILRNTPIRAYEPRPAYEIWNCVAWVKEALLLIQRDGEAVGSSVLDWAFVRYTAMWYVKWFTEKMKSDHLNGRGVEYERSNVATWDLMARQEATF